MSVPPDSTYGWGPCDWPVSYASDCVLPDDATTDQQATRALAESMAIQMLWAWTGQRFGLCSLSVRPCRTICHPVPTFWGRGPYPRGGSGYQPMLIGGAWYNVSCGACGPSRSCGCSTVPTLVLPGPVAAVEEVLVGGAVLPPSSYRIDNWSLLVRTDGQGWPYCQDLAAPVTAPDTFSITYLRGIEVPTGGQVAAGLLACEIDKGLSRDKSCILPQRVQNITRQGITMTMLDTFDDVERGRTGIWLVDSWVASVSAVRPQATVRSVDLAPARQRVTTWPH